MMLILKQHRECIIVIYSVGNTGTCTSENLIVEIREDDINGEVIARQDIIGLNAQELRWLHVEISKDSVLFWDDVKSFYANIYSADTSGTDICEIVYLYKPSDVEYSESLRETRKVIYEAIEIAINEVERMDKDVFVSLKGKEVLSDNYWVTENVYNTFADVVKVAEAQMYQASMSGSDINHVNTLLEKVQQLLQPKR